MNPGEVETALFHTAQNGIADIFVKGCAHS
jgi:hypothetical protein